MRRVAIKASSQRPHSTTVSTINPSYCCLPVASLLVPKRIALLRTHLPRQPNPHSRVRGALRAPPPAGSFLGGFRTPATVHLAPSFMAGIRNPAQQPTSQLAIEHMAWAGSFGLSGPNQLLRGGFSHSGNVVPNIGRPLRGSALVASSCRTSQCSASTPSATRTTSVAIQLLGLPVPENRPWTIT
jgi:hypothetical protein